MLGRSVSAALLFCLGACLVTFCSGTVQDLAKANSGFGFKLYKKIAEQDDAENIFFSPYSISTALAMTYLGAGGNTQTEMMDALGFSNLDKDTVKSSYKELIGKLFIANENYTLKSANKFYSQEGFPFESDFKADLTEFFKSDSQEVDFAKNAEVARELINKWVASQTEDTIKELFGAGSIDPSTVMVLVNALYFKADWFFKFDTQDTKTENFNLLDGNTVSVPMMQLEKKFKLKKSDKYAALEIPYKGENLAMYIILPSKSSDLKEVEDSLNSDVLDTLFDGTYSTTVKLSLPKFKVTQKMELPDILKAMGINDLFTDQADLTEINKNGNLAVSDVVHQAYISIDEEGTEASAATGVGIVLTSIQFPEEFQVDRPFIFFIRDKSTGTNLFMGRVVNPETATKPLALRMMRSVDGESPSDGATDHKVLPVLVTCLLAMAIAALLSMRF